MSDHTMEWGKQDQAAADGRPGFSLAKSHCMAAYCSALLTGCMIALLLATAPAEAQTTFPGDLQQLKAEVQRRALIDEYPLIGFKLSDVREAMARLKSKGEDDWASAWLPLGDRYFAAARREEKEDPSAARGDYSSAYAYYSLARWPTPTSLLKQSAYRKSLECFFAWDHLVELPAKVLRAPFEGQEVVAYLRLPKGAKKSPLLIHIAGLDGYKEANAMTGSLAYARMGVAVLDLDAPGTSQGVIVTPDAWRSLAKLIDQVLALPEIDRQHVVLYGGSWGAYWSTLLAYTIPDRFTAVVSQGAGVDRAFAANHIDEVKRSGEYLFDWEIALEHAFGVTTIDELKTRIPSLSLKTQGYLNRPTPPMLIGNGALDSLFPVEDLVLLLRTGTAKEAWINPKGIHMGRETGVWDNHRIASEVFQPWIFRYLNVASTTEEVRTAHDRAEILVDRSH